MSHYVTYAHGGEPRLGALVGAAVVDLAAADSSLPVDLLSLVRAGPDAWSVAAEVADRAPAAHRRPCAEVRLLAPLTPPRNVFAVGLNYVAHLQEGAAARSAVGEVPDVPVFFTKPPSTVVGTEAPIPWQPAVTRKLDWEAELAIVVGRGGRDIPRAEALEHVFGYTAANDVSARDLQFRHRQWFKGKSLDGCCPLGPAVVTADELGDPQQLDVGCRVNGVVKQKASTSQMIFPVAEILECLSAGMTLEPGDVILTGTPEGVGFARTPPEFLSPGDVVEVEISGIGVLRNVVGGSGS
jgi:2,4-diketo-3-deoxy-L-fuconate hydrolase